MLASHRHSIILVSSNDEFLDHFGGSGIVNMVVRSVEELPKNTSIKGVVIAAELATEVDLSWVRRAYPTAFIAVFNPAASENPMHRVRCIQAGANMIAHDLNSLVKTLVEAVIPAGLSGGRYSCPYCQLQNLSEEEMWFHCPAYHINWPNDVRISKSCPICSREINGPMQVHIHYKHNPLRSSGHAVNARNFTQLYSFSLVICHHPITNRFLLCQEFADQGFWCPGGAVDPGETLTVAAKRETLEEAGVDVDLKGVLAIEFNPFASERTRDSHLVRMRVIFYAEPSELGLQQLPKSCPDFESVGACWCSYEEILGHIPLRGNEPRQWSRYLMEGGQIYPLSILHERTG